MTQRYYGRDSNCVYVDYNAISEAFMQVGPVAIMTNLPVIHPRIGTGLANGDWSRIESLINRALTGFCESTLYVHDSP